MGHAVTHHSQTFQGTQSIAGLLDAQQALKVSGWITPPQITTNQNNYNPANLSSSSVLRVSTDDSRNITGLSRGQGVDLAALADGRVVGFENVGAFDIVLKNQDTNSTAENRFLFGTDLTIPSNGSAAVWYDSTSLRWRLLFLAFAATAGLQTITLTGDVIGTGTTTIPTKVNRIIQVAVTDPNGDAITTGDGKAYVRINVLLNGYNLTAVAAQLSTVSSSGLVTVQIRNVTDAVDMLSTKITIDAGEKDSGDATTPAVIDVTKDDVATKDQIAIDIDGAGTDAKGLIVDLTFSPVA